LWKAAQTSLSQQIDLNPLQRQFSSVAPDILPGDSRALGVSPHQLVVSSQPDVTSAALYAATGTNRPDPTGLIVCPQPCNVSYAAAYSLYLRPASHYAASWEFTGNNFDALVQYEFENQILKTLGHDMKWRLIQTCDSAFVTFRLPEAKVGGHFPTPSEFVAQLRQTRDGL
jgi:hypothetical protein